MRLRLKRHYKLLVLLVLVPVGLVLGLGDLRITAYTVPGSDQSLQQYINYDNDVALFDDTVVHSIQLLITEEDYQQMITTYQETSEKDYFHADVIIDGVRVNNVGVRLKGNASLRTALGGRWGMGGGWGPDRGENRPGFDPENLPGPGERPEMPERQRPNEGEWPEMPEGGQWPEMPEEGQWPGMPEEGQQPEMPEGGQWPEMPEEGQRPNQGGMPFQQGGAASKIPLLIKFDEFVDGQCYQGYFRLAIRTYGTSSDAAMLQEPVTNAVLRSIGLPTTQTAYVGFRLNDAAEQLYTISEVIDESYLAEYFPNSNGVLYKAELGSNLRYQGEDPSAYTRSFTQETRVNDADLGPLVDFIRFLNESDDATFESELPTYLDVDALATYLAGNNLLVNADSLAGMGNNYYLYYDDVAERFTLLMWDANESLGKLSFGSQAATYDLYYQGRQGQGRGGMGGMGDMGGEANILVMRFLDSPTFKALYEQKLRQICQQVFADGAITRQVERYAALVRQANEQRDLVVLEDYDTAVTRVLDFISQRSDYLSTTPLLSGQFSLSR